ncbi:MAG: pyrroline-5-carboxylate reductase [Bacteroidaceae bacterium]|nr:pyrroline-5-carboxylate reductase [Bacteroidaceae bacterium]
MKLSVIGCGAMGGSMVEGWLKTDIIKPADITAADPYEGSLSKFSGTGITTTTDNNLAAKDKDIVCVVVKPWLVEQVLGGIKNSLSEKQTLIVVAAGVSLEKVKSVVGNEISVVLCIPNTAIAVKASMTFIVPDNNITPEQLAVVESLFNSTGSCMKVAENQLSAATVLASCGIAYAMRYVRAASEGGVQLGFKADAAKDIVLQTVKGAVELLQASGNHPEAEIDKVTTPGGLTIRGLNAMEQNGFSNAVIRGLLA